jgi:predicted  nucleic acid-binding Zn-ribbon protein
MNQARALFQLQQIDLNLDKRRRRLREITAALEQDVVLRQARDAVTTVQETLRPQETRATDLNLEIQSVTSQSTQLTNRLYGGKVNNPKELQDIQDKIAELKRRRSSLEDSLLETMIKIEELQVSLATAQERLGQVENERSAELMALTDEQKRLKREIKTLKTERESAVQQVTADNLELYETLRGSKQGQAVSTLDGEMCSYCRVGQTTTLVQRVRQGNELVVCYSCGRILVTV